MIARLHQFVSDLPQRLKRRTTGVYRPEVDGLRFVAIMIVVVGHAFELAEHYSKASRTSLDQFLIQFFSVPMNGVLLFFAVSGFILCSQYLKEGISPVSPVFLKKYFRRRILRIEPPYVIVLTLLYLGFVTTHYVPTGSGRFGLPPTSLSVSYWASLFYSHGWIYGTFPRIFPPGWSLEIEVQFYILAPLLFLLYFSIPNRRLRALLATAAILMTRLLNIPDETRYPVGGTPHLYFTILKFIPYFWIGLIAADLRPALRDLKLKNWANNIIGFGSTAVLASSALIHSSFAPFVKLLAIFLMFLACFQEDTLFRRVLAHPWVSLIGGACYSIYLTHLIVLQPSTQLLSRFVRSSHLWSAAAALMLVEIPVVLALALVFYAYIERTFMLPNWPSLLMAKIAAAGRPGSGAQRPAERAEIAMPSISASESGARNPVEAKSLQSAPSLVPGGE